MKVERAGERGILWSNKAVVVLLVVEESTRNLNMEKV